MPRDRPPRIWESLKRALGGVGADPRRDPAPPPRLPERPEIAAETDDVLSPPPFLLPDEPSPAVPEPTGIPPTSNRSPAPPMPPVEPADSAERPRLARGLASFSRSNADREKKFAHLLRDDASSGKKKPQP